MLKIAIAASLLIPVLIGLAWVNINYWRAPTLPPAEEAEEKKWWQALGF